MNDKDKKAFEKYKREQKESAKRLKETSEKYQANSIKLMNLYKKRGK